MEALEKFTATTAGTLVVCWIIFCIAIETFFSYREGKHIFIKERLSSFTIAIIGPLLAGKVLYLLILNFAFINIYEKYALFKFPLNKWWTWILFFIAADLCTYIIHYMEHRVRVFWCSHEVHHSVKHMTVESSIRTSPLAAIYGSCMRLVLPLIGFHPILHHLETLFFIAFSALNHNTHIGRIKILDWLLNTPSNHRVHHSRDIGYLDKNYGSYLMIWDHLFGTYKVEDAKMDFGLTKNRETDNPLKLIAEPYYELLKDIRNSKNIKTALQYIFYPPGWNPDPDNDTRAEVLQRKMSNI